jgi:hypothetical protein
MAQRPGGIGILFMPEGAQVEVETSTCAHCQHLTDIPSRRKMMDYVDVCRVCDKLVCLACAGGPCTPHMRKIEQMERDYYRKMQNAKLMGIE